MLVIDITNLEMNLWHEMHPSPPATTTKCYQQHHISSQTWFTLIKVVYIDKCSFKKNKSMFFPTFFNCTLLRRSILKWCILFRM